MKAIFFIMNRMVDPSQNNSDRYMYLFLGLAISWLIFWSTYSTIYLQPK